jgi:hypothetical protein
MKFEKLHNKQHIAMITTKYEERKERKEENKCK